MNRLICLLILLYTVMQGFAQKDSIFEKAVYESVDHHMRIYPKSTLKDLYKHFFQDKFGPGHMINDTEEAKTYLLRELDSYSVSSGELAEPTGWQHNFYRVNLSVLKNNQMPLDTFMDAFIRSVNSVTPVSLEDWKKEWLRIETIIQSMNLSLPGYEKDSNEIQERLKEGKYVGHHSKIFNDIYEPHYRIINKKIYEKEILPLLKSLKVNNLSQK